MNSLGTIYEHDVFPDRSKRAVSEYADSREAVRFVLFDAEGKVALNHRPEQQGHMELFAVPGGGIEEGETVEGALAREALEETGCEITDVIELGYIMEYGAAPGLAQKTHVFTAKVLKKHAPVYTEKEQASNWNTVWLPFNNAVKTIQDSSDSFAKMRSLLVLKVIGETK